LRPETQSKLSLFLRAVAAAPQSLLLLDYDGTLAAFRKQRELALPYPGVSEAVQEIMRNGRTRVVVISGRDAKEVVPLLGVHPRPEVWGLHGAQRLKLDGTLEIPQLPQETRNALSAAENWLHYQRLHELAEFKPGSIAIHWRGADETAADEIRARALLGWMHIAQNAGLDLLEFDGGVEIRGHAPDKGDAVRTLLAEMQPQTPTAYLGDDRTDERAFRALNGRGVSILVRPVWRKSAAQLWLQPPEELLQFLLQWGKALREHSSSCGEAVAAVNG